MESATLRSLTCTLIIALFVSCSTEETNTGPISDDTPPAAILDLSVTLTEDEGSAVLQWTAPGGDGTVGAASSYDLRYGSAVLISESDWDSATVAAFTLKPSLAGSSETIQIQLPVGTWFLGIKAADEVPNWSSLSNVVEFTQPVRDSTPPGRVSDLGLELATSRSIVLGWTAPGDDGDEGIADHYDIRYSKTTISEETWESATRSAEVPPSLEPGLRQSATISGLALETEYSFALRTIDEAGNSSPTSNVLGATTAGFEPVQLTPMRAGRAGSPAWSPDGETIAFTANWKQPQNIYTMSSWGGTPKSIDRKGFVSASAPQWTTDGERISYVVQGGASNALWIVEATLDRAPSFLFRHSQGNSINRYVRSPDDNQIAYVVQVDAPPNYQDLFVVSSSGGTPTLLSSGGTYRSLSWSPDGETLLFAENGAIWTQPLDGGSAVEVQLEQRSISSPAWSPDGSRIAFASPGDGNSTGGADIWVVSVDGTKGQRLTNSAAGDFDPAWSPDGSQIAFTRGSRDIWVVSADGAGAHPVAFSRGVSSPTWSPDGTRLLYSSVSDGLLGSIWVVEVE